MSFCRRVLVASTFLLMGCDRSISPAGQGRSFAPRLASVPSGTGSILVEIGYQQFTIASTNLNLLMSDQAPISQGSMTVNGLPSSTSLWFRVSGMDSSNVPLWWAQGQVPNGENGLVQIGNGGIQTTTPPTPSFSIYGTSLQIQCQTAGNWPTWTLNGSIPSPDSSSTLNNGSSSSATIPQLPVQSVKARCTDGWAWGPVGSWTALNSGNLPTAGTALPEIVIQAPSGSPGQLSFSSPGGIDSRYTDPQAAVKNSSQSTPTLVALGTTQNESIGTLVTAYLVAWDNTNSRWVAGPVDTLTVGYTIGLSQPTFEDKAGNILSQLWLKDTTVVALQILSPGTTILFTTNQVDPVPGDTGVSTWLSGLTLPFPATQDTLVLKAIAYQGNSVSPVATLKIARPPLQTWTRLDTGSVGCLSQVLDPATGSQVVACGDGRGPLRWMGTGWIRADPDWNHGTVGVLSANDTEILAAVGSQIYRQTTVASAFQVWSVPMENTVTGLARFHDSLWAGSADGIYRWNGTAWTRSPGSPGIAAVAGGAIWTSPDNMYLWVGSAGAVWRYDGSGWIQSTGVASAGICGFATDPWNTNGTGLLVASTSALLEYTQIGETPTGNSVASPDGLRQIALSGAKIYAAFDNGGGQGEVGVATSWTSGWSNAGDGWPQVPAQAVAVYGPLSGDKLLIASTPSGIWTLPIP